MPPRPLDVTAIRRRFPGLLRTSGDRQAVFFDGPAGSQVPRSVADAVAHYLLFENANHGGVFATAVATDAVAKQAGAAMADLFGTDDREEIVFGPNMTTLTFQLSRALARTWRAGDEIVVTDSDHDANIAPWELAARDAGCVVRRIAIRPDASLDLDSAERWIGPKTRLVAFGAASNLSGTIHPIVRLCELARGHGALSYVDAVHYAPHHLMDVPRWGCDFAVASAYKFFGPHAGILWGRHPLLEEIEAYKVRPASDHGAEKWQTGTASFEAMAGTTAAVDYLAGLGREHGEAAQVNLRAEAAQVNRRAALAVAFGRIEAHERALGAALLAGLGEIPGVGVVGIADPGRTHERCPTVSFTHPGRRPDELARALAERHVHCWPGNSYAVAPSTALGLEPDGALRLGALHYNTMEEVDYTVSQLRELLA